MRFRNLTFTLISLLLIGVLSNHSVVKVFNSFILLEQRHPLYWDYMSPDKIEKIYVLRNLALKENYTNIIVNRVKEKYVDGSYSIYTHPDGSIGFKGFNFTDEDIIEPIDDNIVLNEGYYILSDGGASRINGPYLKLDEIRYNIGGGTDVINLANLPEKGQVFVSDTKNVSYRCSLVIPAGFYVEEEIVFFPMLCENNNELIDNEPAISLYADYSESDAVQICKIDIEKDKYRKISKADWQLLKNCFKFKKNAFEWFYIDFLDGTGITFNNNELEDGVYGIIDRVGKIAERYGTVNFDEEFTMIDDKGEAFSSIESGELINITTIEGYLSNLLFHNYTVFLSVKDEGTYSLSEYTSDLLRQLGLELSYSDDYRNSIIFIYDNGSVKVIKKSLEALMDKGILTSGDSFIISIKGYEARAYSSVVINGTEYSMNRRGMNIVVFDPQNHKVVDTVCFDTHSGLECYRPAGGLTSAVYR